MTAVKIELPERIVAGSLYLSPLGPSDIEDMQGLTSDEDVRVNTRVPIDAPDDFAEEWIKRYTDGANDGTRVGFSIRDETGAFLGFMALIDIDREGAQGEIGYIVAPAARGQGVATTALRRISEWAFEELGLLRLQLLIKPSNAGSLRIAEKAGYVREGITRSLYFKEGERSDFVVFSLLPDDPRR